jgi:integrase/recombinase XerC
MLDEMVNEFLDYLRYERRRSPETITSYSCSIREFEDFFHQLDNGLDWSTVDEDVVRDWMEHLVDGGMEASSVGTRFAALRSLFKFALARHLVERDPTYRLEPPKKAKRLPTFLKESEMNRLLDDLPWGTSFKDVRDKAIITTFYETGIRLSELTSLNDVDIDSDYHQLKVTGKGNKQRVVPYGEELARTLRDYMACRDREVIRHSDAVFVTSKGKRMTSEEVRTLVKDKLSLVSSQKKLSPHVLRHTFATAMLNNGASIESVRRLLGHASASTTEVYTHTTFEQLRRVYKNAHPRA